MSTRAEASSIFTPIIVLAGVVVIVLAAGKVLMQPTGGPVASTEGGNGFFGSLFGSTAAMDTTGDSAVATDPMSEDQRRIESELEFWSSRLQRAESDMQFAEEVAMSQSDVIGVRHRLGTLDEDIAKLHRYAADYKQQEDELLASSDSSRIAGNERLLLEFYELHRKDRMSPREITQLTERIAPLKGFVETLESRSDAAYRPRPQFDLRVNRFINDVSASVEHYRSAFYKLRRLQRASMNEPTSAETLEEAVYRLKEDGHARIDSSSGRLIPDERQREDRREEDFGDGDQLAMATPEDYRSRRQQRTTSSQVSQQPQTYQSSPPPVYQASPSVPVSGYVSNPVWVTYQSPPVIRQQRVWRQSCGCRNCRCRCR